MDLPPQAKRRLQKDIMNAQQDDSLHKMGIYYWMNEENIMSGKALILGPEGTPYEGGIFIFSVNFPHDYPFSPPKVLFMTGDGYTRFHPNLYKEGKVCLSILGTWQGPSWTSTQSLTSVLVSIQGLMDTNPLANEPSFERGTLAQAAHKNYADAIEHQVAKYMVEQWEHFKKRGMDSSTFLRSGGVPLWREFAEVVEKRRPELVAHLQKKTQERATGTEKVWQGLTYGMQIETRWGDLAKRAKEL